MASTNTTNDKVTNIGGSSGGINMSPEMLEQMLGGLSDAFGSAGVAELTPEMQAAISAMMGQQGGQGMVDAGSGLLGQAGGILGGNMTQDADSIKDMAGALVDQEFLGNQLGQLNESAQEALGQSLGQIETGASMAGGLGSSRTALAQGQAIGDSNEALANAQANLVGQTYQNAMNQAIGVGQNNISNSLAQGGALGQLGLGQAGLGQSMNKDKINAMLAAGTITQDQANAMMNSNFNKYLQLIPALGGILGTTEDKVITENSNQSSEVKPDWWDFL